MECGWTKFNQNLNEILNGSRKMARLCIFFYFTHMEKFGSVTGEKLRMKLERR